MSLTVISSLPTEAELRSYQFVATVASNNPFWRKVGGGGTPDQVVATILSVMLLARELGISPMQAISGGINNIQGKFEISARIMNQLIRRHGHSLKVLESTHDYCVIWTKRKDTGEETTIDYHIEEAARAGLIKDGGGWKKCPKDMLFARCISRIARQIYPDCIGGCYVEGELQETMQKKLVDVGELPTSEELEIATPSDKIESIEWNLPDGINPIAVDEYLKECAEMRKCSVFSIKKRASQNMDKFLEAFRAWQKEHDDQLENNFVHNEVSPDGIHSQSC